MHAAGDEQTTAAAAEQCSGSGSGSRSSFIKAATAAAAAVAAEKNSVDDGLHFSDSVCLNIVQVNVSIYLKNIAE